MNASGCPAGWVTDEACVFRNLSAPPACESPRVALAVLWGALFVLNALTLGFLVRAFRLQRSRKGRLSLVFSMSWSVHISFMSFSIALAATGVVPYAVYAVVSSPGSCILFTTLMVSGYAFFSIGVAEIVNASFTASAIPRNNYDSKHNKVLLSKPSSRATSVVAVLGLGLTLGAAIASEYLIVTQPAASYETRHLLFRLMCIGVGITVGGLLALLYVHLKALVGFMHAVRKTTGLTPQQLRTVAKFERMLQITPHLAVGGVLLWILHATVLPLFLFVLVFHDLNGTAGQVMLAYAMADHGTLVPASLTNKCQCCRRAAQARPESKESARVKKLGSYLAAKVPKDNPDLPFTVGSVPDTQAEGREDIISKANGSFGDSNLPSPPGSGGSVVMPESSNEP